jgi:hypothetical protein
MDRLLWEKRGVKRLAWRSVAPIGGQNEKRCQKRFQYLEAQVAAGAWSPETGRVVAAAEGRVAAAGDLSQDGLDWLVRKGRISARRHGAAMAYRKAFRDGGGPSIKSSADWGHVGGVAGPGLHAENAALAYTQAQRDLHTIRTRVCLSQDDLVTVLDAVCGVGIAPRALAGGDGHRAATLEAVLMVALDLVARWLDTRAVKP